MDNRNPYHVLGVANGADLATCRKAYKKLALKLHPDKNRGDQKKASDAEEAFTKLSEAFETLSKKHDQASSCEPSTDVRDHLFVCLFIISFVSF